MTATATASASEASDRKREPRMSTPTNIVVSRVALRDALAKIALVAPRGAGPGGLPVLQCVRITQNGGALALTGTDLDRIVSVTVPVEPAEPPIGAGLAFPTCVVPCHRLAAIVERMPEGPVSVTPIAKSHGLRVMADRARVDLAGLPADEFPIAEADGRANEWIGDILGPATFDDEAELWGSLSPGGIPTPMIIDAKFGFQLLGDTWYRQRGLPTPAEQNLVV
jgi:hypothetical protein